MNVELCRPSELSADHIAQWRDWQASNAVWSSPFLSATFARAVGTVRPDTQVAVISDANRIVGYFPFHRIGTNTGRALGMGVTDHQAIVCAAGFEYSPTELVRQCGLGVFEFDHVGQNSPEANHVEAWETGSIMDVSSGYKTYLEAAQLPRSKTYRSSIAKQRKLAAEIGGLNLDFASKDEAAFRQLLAWKSQQYKRTGRNDRFAVPWIRSLTENLLHINEPDCSGLLSVLKAGERIIGVHFGLRNRTDIALWFPAYDRDLSRYSPGTMFHLQFVEAAANQGVRQLDLGKGDEDYKTLLRTGTYRVGEGAVMLRTSASARSWARRVPKRQIKGIVLRHDRLRQYAREGLKLLGRIRT